MGCARQVVSFKERKIQREKTFEEIGLDERKLLKWIYKRNNMEECELDSSGSG
jgi:hypothetical protein